VSSGQTIELISFYRNRRPVQPKFESRSCDQKDLPWDLLPLNPFSSNHLRPCPWNSSRSPCFDLPIRGRITIRKVQVLYGGESRRPPWISRKHAASRS